MVELEGRQIGRIPRQVDRAALLRDRENGKSIADRMTAYRTSKASVCRVLKDAQQTVSKGAIPTAVAADDSKELRPPESAA